MATTEKSELKEFGISNKFKLERDSKYITPMDLRQKTIQRIYPLLEIDRL